MNRLINMERWLQATAVWHVGVSLADVALIVWVWGTEWPLWGRIVLTVAFLLHMMLNWGAITYFPARQHRGRSLSLAANYLGFLVSLLLSLHYLGIFLGLDALANTFAQGLPFLGLAFVGYLVGGWGDRYEGTARQRQLQTAGKWIAAVAGIFFLLSVGIGGAILAILAALRNSLTLGITVSTGLFGLFCWLMWRQKAADAFNATVADSEMLDGYLLLSPNLVGFLIFFVGPLIFSFYVSLTNSDAFGTADFVGLDNYIKILDLDVARLTDGAQRANEVLDILVYDEVTRVNLFGTYYVIGAADKLFWLALGNTLKFVLYAVPISVIPALFLANLLNSDLPGMRIFRALYFLPSVAAVVGIALVWQWLFNSTIGYINYAITGIINLLNSIGGDFVDPAVRWLSNSDTALLAVVVMMAWRLVGFNTVLFLAGLQNIPKVLYEAATVDGAGPWRQFISVTLPMLAPTTFFVVITTLITTFQVFEDVFILMGNNPAGPGNSTLVMVLYLYQKGFQRFELGYASAIAWVLFLLIFVATLAQARRQSGGGAAYE
ncbi:MAG: sugar ABC transporter permease [Chloroflexi bacterium]|nr:sugar ABC transporter permease [Chloroflexota bacterium]